jgi:import receptor subunit TOM70
MAPLPPPQAQFSVPVPPPSAPTVNQSILTKTQRFIEENQRLILLGCAVAAAGGAGYYLYNRSSNDSKPSSGSSSTPGSSSSSKKKNKKKNKKSGLQSGFLKGEGSQGPLLEEIEKPKQPAGEKSDAVEGSKEKAQDEATSHLSDIPEASALAAMSEAVCSRLGKLRISN